MVIVLFVHPDTPNKEGISIHAVNAEDEESQAYSSDHVGFSRGISGLLQEPAVDLRLSLLLTECNDHTDG